MKRYTFLILMMLVSVVGYCQELMRTIPFLQNPVDGGVTVTWLTNMPAFSYVEYGTDKNNLTKAVTMVDGQIIAGNKIHRIRLNGIKAGQKYYYRAVSKEITLYQAYKKEFGDSVVTQLYEFSIPEKGSDFRAVVYNDLHRGNATTEALTELIENQNYNIALFNGDCIDDPQSEADVVNFIEHAARVVGKGSVPLIFIRGNHEIRGQHSIFLRDIIEYSTAQSYGSFTWGDIRFVILDCGEDKLDSSPVYYGLNDFEGFRLEQVDFLKQELKSKEFKKASKRVLIHHIPIYYPEEMVGKEYNPCYELWQPLLEKAKFNVALNAHTHSFAFYEKGEIGNNFPIIVGGGPQLEIAGVVLIIKEGDLLITKYINSSGETLALVEN